MTRLSKELFALMVGVLPLFSGCRTIKIPVEHRVEVSYIDSLRIKDSTVYIPRERIVDLVPAYDTLRMETSKAKAEAYVDTTTHTLRGSIENKTGVEYKYIYKDRVEYRDSLVYQDVPVPVEVTKTVHPRYEAWLWAWLVISLLLVGFWVYTRFFLRK